MTAVYEMENLGVQAALEHKEREALSMHLQVVALKMELRDMARQNAGVAKYLSRLRLMSAGPIKF